VENSLALDRRACDRARRARDARFDGRFFTGVLTTRIYCRPTCPVKPAKSRNVVFFPTAAAAERAGFRGFLDDGGTVEELALTLGMTARHLRHLFLCHAGASPVAVATTTRVQRAKSLIEETAMPMAAVAFAAGFSSIRRFNAAFRSVYRRPPTAIRRARSRPGPSHLG
jgi:AraC family transcriptional regulator, regulatory protein of adaptative response / methylated-DNA-[protein]-cysteine methyltransferase